MSTFNTVVFAVSNSIARKMQLAVLSTARKESNMACTVWTWDWVESNKLASLDDWMEENEDLDEHWYYLRTGESDHDNEVRGGYEDCGYRIAIASPESEKPYDCDVADMLLYLIDSEYDSFLDYVLESNPECEGIPHEEVAAKGLADDHISHIWKTAKLKLAEMNGEVK